MKLITYAEHLIVIAKIQYILYNVINVGNNTLAILKLSFVVGLTIIKVKFKNKKQVPKEALK